MESAVSCYYTDSLSHIFSDWADDLHNTEVSHDMLQQVLSSPATHDNCGSLDHETFTQHVCTLLSRALMSNIVGSGESQDDPTSILKFVAEGNGLLVLRCLLKLGTKHVGCKEDLCELLWYLIKLKQSASHLPTYDVIVYNEVCSVCVQLVADLCHVESRQPRVKLVEKSLPELTKFVTNLLVERKEITSDHSSYQPSMKNKDGAPKHHNPSTCLDNKNPSTQHIAVHLESVDSLMKSSVTSYCHVVSMMASIQTVHESDVLSIVGKVASVYARAPVSTCQSSPQVLSACLVGRLKVLESTLSKPQALANSMKLCEEVLHQFAVVVPANVADLINQQMYTAVRDCALALLCLVRRMKECKEKQLHSQKCRRKKHRHCDLYTNIHHHSNLLSIQIMAKQHCAVAYLTKLALKVILMVPHDRPLKVELLESATRHAGCCCMNQSELVRLLLADGLAHYSEASVHAVMSSLCSLILNQLSGDVASNRCEKCSLSNLRYTEDTTGVSTLHKLLTSDMSEMNRRAMLGHLSSLAGQSKPDNVFLLYRYVFRPVLDSFHNSPSAGLSADCLQLCLSALTHCLKEEDCLDHFLSSAYSMKMLEQCASLHNVLLPQVLQVFNLLMQLRSEDQVLTPLLNVLLGEPAVKPSTSDFVVIELIYETPNFDEPLSHTHMMIINEKWNCCYRLLHQSSLFRDGFQSKGGIQLLLRICRSAMNTMISNSKISSEQTLFVGQLLSTVTRCLQLCALHQLNTFKKTFTVEDLCEEIKETVERCELSSDVELSGQKSYELLNILIDCSSHNLPAGCAHGHCMQVRRKNLTCEDEQTSKRAPALSASDKAASVDSSSEEYEADAESCEDAPVFMHRCMYENRRLIQPELWLLVFDLMTSERLSLTNTRLYSLLSTLDRVMRNVESWQCLTQKVALALRLLRWYRKDMKGSGDEVLSSLILSTVKYICYLEIDSGVLLELFTLLRDSLYQDHLLSAVHTVITQSRRMPSCSVSFPLDRNDKENDIGVIVSTVEMFGTMALSVVVWVYLDGSISAGYNSQNKSNQPVQLLNIIRSQLTIALRSQVTNGDVSLVIGNETGDVIGCISVPSVLTTNKWQMVSFNADIKRRENLQFSLQFSLGVDGKELAADSNTYTAPSKIAFDDQSNLDLHVGQRSNLYVKERSIHLANTLIFAGRLTNSQCAELYALGPAYSTYSRSCAELDDGPVDRRCSLGRHLPSAALQQVLDQSAMSQLQNTLQHLVTVVGPEYKPFCLLYNRYPLTSGDKYSTPNTRHRLFYYMSTMEQVPAAYYGELSIVGHTSLEDALACLGGSSLLLYMYAQCVELRLSELSQQLALECLLHSCSQYQEVPKASQQPLDYQLLSKVLQSERCQLTADVTQVLINFAIRRVEDDVLLVDMPFIEHVLLDWVVWQARPLLWKPIWLSLCQSVAEENRFSKSNCQALLDSELLQSAMRIPMVQHQKDASDPLSRWVIGQLSLVIYRTLQLSHNKRLVWDICRQLLLLHPAAATYIQYGRNKFYPTCHWDRLTPAAKSSASSLNPRTSQNSTDVEKLYALGDSTELADEAKETLGVVYTSDGEAASDYSTDTPISSSDSEAMFNDDTNAGRNKVQRTGSSYTITEEREDDSEAEEESTDTEEAGDMMSLSELTVHSSARIAFNPSSPTFALGMSAAPDRPDIIKAHDDPYESDVMVGTTTDDSISAISANLLYTLFLISNDLSTTDKHIFCADLMTLDMLTLFLNHEDLDVVYNAFKLLSRVIEISSSEELERFINKKGLHMVASQLNQVTGSDKLVSACILLLNGPRCCSMAKNEHSHAFLLPLMGILDRCCHDISLISKALLVLFQTFEERSGILGYAVHNGLVQVLANCLKAINDLHPHVDNDAMDTLLTYIHISLQKVAAFIVSQVRNEVKVDYIYSLLCLFILLERRQRNDDPGSYVTSRTETTLRLVFQELYANIKQEAMAKPVTLYQRIFSMGASSEGSKGLEDSAGFSMRRVSMSSGANLLSTSMNSLHSLPSADIGESKISKASLTDMLLSTLQQFVDYAMYRASYCPKHSEMLISAAELLLDTLIVQEEVINKRSLWQTVAESDRVRSSVWKMLTDLLTFALSPSCHKTIAESVISLITELPDSSQKRVVEYLTGNDFLLPNLKAFLECTSLKSACESFLMRILTKRNPSKQVGPSPRGHDSTVSGLQTLWVTSQRRARREWRKHLSEVKHRVSNSVNRLGEGMRHSAMEINKDVSHRQNLERKKFVELMKINMAAEVSVGKEWRRLIVSLTHERAVWFNSASFPLSWEIDPTEGPGRVRKRLQRCHMVDIPSRFLLEEEQHKLELSKAEPPLQFLFEEVKEMDSARAALIYRLHTNETISFTCKCNNVTPNTETHGDLLISDNCIHFVGDDAIVDYNTEILVGSHDLLSVRWPHSEIKCFYKRRYQLQDNALEIFLTSGRTSLLAMDTRRERDTLWEKLSQLRLPNMTSSADLESIQKEWVNGRMTNFDYLTHLNTLAGRSFNDLMQYPVFPFLLNKYIGPVLDLNDISSYRKLNKPIASQKLENERKFKQHYEAIEADIELCKRSPEASHAPLAPYHYASHYSNSGVVLHYLIRLLPYTHMFLKYQDGQFDIPDRTFHSMHTSWMLSSETSATDVKELIPEFYYLPEFMVNYEGFNFGKRQNKEQVADLNLPEWCRRDSRLFVLILRQALESQMVTSNLQHWINLIFGYQQQGEAAKEAINKFHPATYFGLEVDNIDDELQLNAIKVMIRTYGQMPKQLFTSKHPAQSALTGVEQRLQSDVPVLDTVTGLRWGGYVGSPADAVEPRLVLNEKLGAERIVAVTDDEIFALTSSSCVITYQRKPADELSNKADFLWASRLTWGHSDNVLRLQTQKDKQPINFLSLPYKVTVCAGLADSSLLFVASHSGVIQVHKIHYSKVKTSTIRLLSELTYLGLEVSLIGHHSPISSLIVSKEYSVVVSADESGLCIIWDLNKLCYVRCIQNETDTKIDCVTISPTMGDIAFCSAHGSGSVVEVFTINAQLISRLTLSEKVSWLCYSSAPEGLSVNVLAGALSNGTVRLWSSWDLKPLRTFSVDKMSEPFICCTFTEDNQRLAANTDSGRVVVWERYRIGPTGKPRCLPAD